MPSRSSPKKSREDYRMELPVDRREEFDRLVADYRFASVEVTGREFVSYAILQKLIEAGWRDRESGPLVS